MAGQDGFSVHFPNEYIGELLTELAMVEMEISRLESQINALQSQAKHEQSLFPASPDYDDNSSRTNEKGALEKIRALHFISRAISGDHYKLDDFSLSKKAVNSRRFPSQDETTFHGKGGKIQEKGFRGNGVMKHPSPLRSRHQTPGRSRVHEIHSDNSPKVLSALLHSDTESVQKWSPNKLSENIMKCLILIFMRLLRTAKATALEKSWPRARSTNLSLSFWAETSPEVKSGLMFQKDSRQQDPYGIFNTKESVQRDIGHYKNLVRFRSSSLNFNCIQNSGFLPLFQKLKILMDGLQKVDLRFLSHRQKLAFWINMFNSCIMHGYLQFGLPSVSSPEKMLTLINQANLNIAGHSINAQTIENFILRKPSDSLDKQIYRAKEMMIHELYGLKTPDPNITFALSCGTHSSPAVKIYTAEGVTAELDRSKMEYLQAAIMVTTTKRVALPELLLRNISDFGPDVGSLMEWLCHQLPASGCLRKSIASCFRRVRGGRAAAAAVVEMIPYDFEFQYLFAV